MKERFLIKQFVAMGASLEQAKIEVRRLKKRKMLERAFMFYYAGVVSDF